MVRPLDREDHQGDMVRVLLVDNLDIVVDMDQEAVDNLGDLDNLEDGSLDVRGALEVDSQVDHFDVQVHPVYLVVMLVHLTLVIAVLKSGVLVELEERIGTVVRT